MRLASTISGELLGPEGAAQFAWSPTGDLLAAAGLRKKKVVIFDSSGGVVASLTVPDPEFLYDEAAEAPVLALSWHPLGSHLAVLPRGQPFAMVWSAGGETARVDSGIKPAEVSALAWNPAQPQLALGTARGGGLIYDCATQAALPLQLGRHAKPVCCAAWSAAAAPGGLLALGCKGGLLLLCRAADGGLVRSVQMKGAVSQLQFCGGAEGTAAGQEPAAGAHLAANVGKRAVCIWQLPQALAGGEPGASGAFELAFREGYGEVEHYCWVHERLLVAGFSSGQLVAVALSGSGGLRPGCGTGTELFSSRCLQQAVAGLSWCAASQTLAAGGGSQLALLSCRGQEVAAEQYASTIDSLEATQRVASLQFSPPAGRLLTVASSGGKLVQLLARPPLLHGTQGGRLLYVDPAVSTTQALLLPEPGQQAAAATPLALPLPVDPEILALGPDHLAAVQGNKVWFQALEATTATGLLPPPEEAEYPAPISWLSINAACALLLGEGGRVFVQPAVSGGGCEGGDTVELRGEDGEPFAASCAALTKHFILLGLPGGTLAFYQACDLQLVSQYQHGGGGGIARAFPTADGAMVLFQDTAGGIYLYNAEQDELMQLPDFAGSLQAAVWDSGDPAVVAAVSDAGVVHVYCLIACSVQGPGLKLVGRQQAPSRGAVPLTLHGGVLAWHLPSGALQTQLLDTHAHLAEPGAGSKSASRSSSGKGQQLLLQPQPSDAGGGVLGREERLAARCHQALALCHFGQALDAARRLGDPRLLREVALTALQFLEVPTAVAAYEAAGDEEALQQLRPLLGMQDGNLLAGRIITITGGDADRAEELLLASSCSAAAIDMRKQLGHWERALELAEQLELHAVGSLALLRAQALEAEGQVEAALALYQQALDAPDLSGAAGGSAAAADCRGGVARCSIVAGEVERGMQLAADSGSRELLVQCAELLEGQQQTMQAGQLYAQAEQYERAAELFLCCREFALLDGVMGHAGSSDLWLRYAQAKEDLGSFGDAARAYEQAGDCLAAIRVYLDRLRDAESAAELAQRMGSSQGCLTVARYCERAGKHQLALEQYCCGGSIDAAFLLAQRADCMPAFASWARGAGSAEAALLAAGHYEAQGQLALAGELCALAGKHERAARLYVQAGGESLPAAIKLAQQAQDPAAAAVVLKHLQAVDGMGAALLELHLSLGNHEQACAVAVARAQQEQAAGNYKAARDQLLQVCAQLQQRGGAATPALLSTLHLLHSYLLVRTLVRQGDHLAAARLLLRVAEGIAAFPKHVVPILTSAVIECHRAALHGPAQRWAAVLMGPQHAGQVSAAYAKKIEAIAKQPAWTAEQAVEEPQCDCLFCGAPGPDTSLTCSACHRGLPFCAASGKRMAMNDWSACPACRFPCRGRDMTRVASVERCCPLCEAPVAVHDVKKIFDPVSHLRRTVFAGVLKEPPAAAAAAAPHA